MRQPLHIFFIGTFLFLFFFARESALLCSLEEDDFFSFLWEPDRGKKRREEGGKDRGRQSRYTLFEKGRGHGGASDGRVSFVEVAGVCLGGSGAYPA